MVRFFHELRSLYCAASQPYPDSSEWTFICVHGSLCFLCLPIILREDDGLGYNASERNISNEGGYLRTLPFAVVNAVSSPSTPVLFVFLPKALIDGGVVVFHAQGESVYLTFMQ